MVTNTHTNDESRRTFLKALGVTGAATSGLLTFSGSAAAAESSPESVNALEFTPSEIVPANTLHSTTLENLTTKRIEAADVLLNGTPVSGVSAMEPNTILVSTFDMLTNADLQGGETARYTMLAEASDGGMYAGTTEIPVVGSVDGALSGTDTLGSTELVETLLGQKRGSEMLALIGQARESQMLSLLEETSKSEMLSLLERRSKSEMLSLTEQTHESQML